MLSTTTHFLQRKLFSKGKGEDIGSTAESRTYFLPVLPTLFSPAVNYMLPAAVQKQLCVEMGIDHSETAVKGCPSAPISPGVWLTLVLTLCFVYRLCFQWQQFLCFFDLSTEEEKEAYSTNCWCQHREMGQGYNCWNCYSDASDLIQ